MPISNTRSGFGLVSKYGDIPIDATADTALAAITTSSTIRDVLDILSACVGRNRVTDVDSTGYATSVQVSTAPTDISLSAASLAVGADGSVTPVTVGTLTTTAPITTSYTYTLVSGTGDDDNADFDISSATLRYIGGAAVGGTLSVRIRTTSVGGQTYEEAFTITVA
jgi:hypothetical protein